MDPETLKAITQLVLNVLAPFLTTAQAQLAATVQLTDEVRRARVAIERSSLTPSDGPSVDDDQGADVPCTHPTDQRVSFASSGNEDFFCKACDELVTQPHVMRS